MTARERFGAIVLAAGRSTRMGGANKLLENVHGIPLVGHAARAALASRARPIVVVTGHQPERIAAALAGLGIALVHNPDYATGLASSLKAGIEALPQGVEAAAILLGDMPFVTGALVDGLLDGFMGATPVAGGHSRGDEPVVAAVPVRQGRWGNPVVLGRALFPNVANLSGDSGARRLLEARRGGVVEVVMDDEAVALDIDTPDALAEARRQDAASPSIQHG